MTRRILWGSALTVGLFSPLAVLADHLTVRALVLVLVISGSVLFGMAAETERNPR